MKDQEKRIETLENLVKHLATDIQILSDAFIRLEHSLCNLQDDIKEIDLNKLKKRK
jgi:septal ring factor EnvC (AmiA/AmiB activator)